MSITNRPGKRSRVGGVAVGVTLVVLALGGTGIAAASSLSGPVGRTDHVGDTNAHGVVLATGQTVSPYGARTRIDNGRLLSSTLSPDGKRLAALSYRNGTGFVSVFDLTKGTLAQQVGTGATGDKTVGDGTVAADGPYYSPDGRTLWVPQTADLLKFSVNPDGSLVTTPTVIPMVTGTTPWLPSGGAYSADGSVLYVALNNTNALAVLDPSTGKVEKTIPVGVAPRQVAVVGSKVYVSNEGGRQATAGDFTNLTSGTPVVADRSTGGVTNGTVSLVDPTAGTASTIPVGLEPTALLVHGNALYVANSNDDSVSVIDTRRDSVVQTIDVNPVPGSSVGSYPNALAMADDNHLLVSIGRDNALEELTVGSDPRSPARVVGLIPTDQYPVAVAPSAATGKIVVTNDKGVGSRGTPKTITEGPDTNPATGPNTYSDTGTLTSFTAPSTRQLGSLTHTVFVDNGWDKLSPDDARTSAKARRMKPVPVPTELGAPSTIKHVFLIVKENRTYDQVLGDVDRGNGDASLTQFGASVTPNHHALVNQFGLFDNFYDEGTLSADGHNWLMQADANDYVEKEFGAFYRSYPAQGGDALAYQRNGFLWNAVEAAGKTVHNFGEYNNFFTADDDPNRPTWAQWYQDSQILEGKAAGPLPVPIDKYRTYADIPSLNAITDPLYPKFDTDVPDQYRADIWLRSFEQSEQSGQLANLTMIWLPDDHTAGTSGASPYPTAAVADNDLALGRIVDRISHSRFWKSSAIFVDEDDTQAGTDHVDGHRAPTMVISPYAKRHQVDHTFYTQLNLVRTIEQILGVRPMNQLDRAAEPMYDAFTDEPTAASYTTRPNQIPLTYGLKTPVATAQSNGTDASHGQPQQVPRALVASPKAVSPQVAALQKQWSTWSTHQHFGGAKPEEDAANPAQLNHLDWYSSTGWTTPYPGESAVLGPYQVPGWNKPAPELN